MTTVQRRPRRAVDLLDLVLDAGSYESWDEPIDTSVHPPAYRVALAAAAERAGTDESVLTGQGLVSGRAVAVVVNEFGFLGGSIGCAAAARIEAAARRATADRLPLLAATASGGTRMQEGTIAFVQMVAITRALADHRAAGLPYLVYLRHPTVGGVYASWGSLGHITVAEPGALIGFRLPLAQCEVDIATEDDLPLADHPLSDQNSGFHRLPRKLNGPFFHLASIVLSLWLSLLHVDNQVITGG